MLLALLTIIFIFQAKQFPYLAIGWLWFFGTLVPVIGLVQVGAQAMADRYTYLPAIGIFIFGAWGLNDLLQRAPRLKLFLPMAAGVSLVGCIAVTSVQLTYWRNSVDIFWHTIKVTDNNYSAYDCLGSALEGLGKTKEAEELFIATLKVAPKYPLGQFHLGMILLQRGDFNGASNHLAEAIKLNPRNPVIQFDFGIFQLQHGDPKQASSHFQAALDTKPDFTEARRYLEQLTDKTNLNHSTP
jgi:tetratricopeptide (TPR) repeat protein